MKGLYFVEPIVAIYAFANFLVYPLVQQYVYRRLWQELTNTSYPVTGNNTRCSNSSSHHEEVQKAASLFSMYTELVSMIPSLTVTLILVSHSDQRGRKITIVLPLVGSLLYTIGFLTVSFFELDLYLILVASFASALFGGTGTLFGGCFSYIADLCQDGKHKTLRMACVDMVIGLLSGVASLSTGYFLRAAGFNWPFFTSALFQCANLLYAVLVLEESRVPDPETQAVPGGGLAMRRLASGICQLFSSASRRRNTLLALLLATFSLFTFSNVGSMSMFTLYELNEPLCWSEILIGYGMALSTTIFLTSFAGLAVLSRCLSDLAIIFVGMLSIFAGLVMTAFAKTTLIMFLVRVPMLLAIMPFPVMRSMMSKVVSKSEQGALFACVAFLESLSGSVAFAVFSSIYAATVAWFPGFTFLLAAGICLVPMAMLGGVRHFGPDDAKDSEVEDLIPGEGAVTEDNEAPLA